jgi:H+/Cl- antiporter ClcA
MTRPHPHPVLLHLFDIRNIVGALLAIYGVLLTIAGFVPAILGDHNDLAAANDRTNLYIGTDANWWVGLILLAIGAVFFTWALLRPLRPDQTEPASDGTPATPEGG